MTNRRIALALCALALVSLPAAAQVCPSGGGEAAYDANWPLNQRNVVVPAGCTKLQLKAWGCGGARGNSPSGGGAGFAQGNFRIPATPARTIALNYNFGGPGTGTGAGCVGLATDVTNSLVPLVVAAGGGGGGNSTEPAGGTPRVGGRGGAGGRNGQAGESVTGDCSSFANGGGGATPTTPGAGGLGTYSNGQNGQCSAHPAGVGPGGPGWWMVSGDGSPGRCGGGGGGAAGDRWSGDPVDYCRYRVGAGGGGGSSAVHVSAFAPLPAVELFGDGLWQVPGNSGDPDRYTPPPANQWAGDGATPSAAATKGRIIARWRGPFGFFDVAPSSPYRPWIEKLACNGITSGCGNDNFCPTLPITRGQMAPWLLVAKEGAGYAPPPCVEPGPFGDVPCSNPYAKWIQELVARQVTGGCGNGNYCPDQAVTREQMAVFLLRTLEGPTYVPPPCTTPTFLDVPCSSPFAPWIEELVRRGITSGCGGGNYCPTAPVTREQMAVFLGVTFSLPDCP